MEINDDTQPIMYLTIGGLKSLIKEIITCNPEESPKDVQLPKIFGSKDFPKYTGYSINSLYQMVKNEEVPFHRREGGRKLIFHYDEIQVWLAQRREKENNTTPSKPNFGSLLKKKN